MTPPHPSLPQHTLVTLTCPETHTPGLGGDPAEIPHNTTVTPTVDTIALHTAAFTGTYAVYKYSLNPQYTLSCIQTRTAALRQVMPLLTYCKVPAEPNETAWMIIIIIWCPWERSPCSVKRTFIFIFPNNLFLWILFFIVKKKPQDKNKRWIHQSRVVRVSCVIHYISYFWPIELHLFWVDPS